MDSNKGMAEVGQHARVREMLEAVVRGRINPDQNQGDFGEKNDVGNEEGTPTLAGTVAAQK